MNFQSFYKNTEKRILDSILSLWASGDANMQQYLTRILVSEKLLAEPVFQNMFPWEPSPNQFNQLTGIFNRQFIGKLNSINNEEFRFPADRHPYLHQEKSWQAALVNEKSILVTTGTGSGKTECFMLPVLQDIFINSPSQDGVNAIFLYPLNALIGSQKRRMHEWCKALGNINYAIYTGNTPDPHSANAQSIAYPEIISREKIRSNPPQILFTNPTMLEYMLVRDKDTQLLNNSKGKLRWILLDEAHTLTGSKAAEMALLIRRVIDAFEVDINNIRFALTSATVGDENDDVLKQFMADLCGIGINNIELIKGKRFLPNINNNVLQDIDPVLANNVRQLMYNNVCKSLTEIGDEAGINDMNDQLAFIDKLAEIEDNNSPIMPIRGHFFARNINGVYACTNPNCNIHPGKPADLISSLTTLSKKLCNCGSPLLELISCRTCGTYMMEGEKANGIVQQCANTNTDFFQVENDSEDMDDEDDNIFPQATKIIIAKELANRQFVDQNILPIEIGQDGSIHYNDNGPFFEVNETCPYCRSSLENPFYFRLSGSFLNRLLSDIVLEETNDAIPITEQMLWKGKKYISFTDSRQGTAKISALINIDSENFFSRSHIYHALCQRYQDNILVLTDKERRDLTNELAELQNGLQNATPFVRRTIEDRISQINNLLNTQNPPLNVSRISWNEMKLSLQQCSDTKNLFYHTIGGNYQEQGSDYANSLLYNEFARRLPRERSLENLGMVNLVYPKIDELIAPAEARDLQITNDEWRSLIKIALDYVIRYKFFYAIPNNVFGMASKRHKSFKIYPADTQIVNVPKWPTFDRHNIRPNRLALIIFAGLGYEDTDQIDNEIADKINDLLHSLWITIRNHFLSSQQGFQDGYKLDLEQKTAFELTNKLWLCPVKKRLIDTTFRGYSPWISGRLAAANIRAFRVVHEIQFPLFPLPFNLDANNTYNSQNTLDWLDNNNQVNQLKQAGLWNSLHERIINFKPLYLAGEHSAQQKKARLEQLEKRFQDGQINILSCSTTMEMGVDIGGISAVVMSNVPPGPANYLQRTGRAGRRRENKSLAFTICPANPIGANVIENPKWAFTHRISPPSVSLSSIAVVERHLNALLLGKFVRQKLAGLNINEKVESFFLLDQQNNTIAEHFLQYLLELPDDDLAQSISKLITGTSLSDMASVAVMQIVYNNFDQINIQVKHKNQKFVDSLNKFTTPINEGGYGYDTNSPAYKAVNYQKIQFINKNLLTYLSENGFLPAGGMPTGVVEFNNIGLSDLNNNDNDNQLPSYHITRALIEYAPGREVVIDGWAYTSSGITLKSNFGQEASRSILQHCTSCGFEHILQGDNLPNQCPACNNQALTGLTRGTSFTEIIEPAGFSVDLFDSKKRDISDVSYAQYVEPLLIGAEPWDEARQPVVEYRDSLPNAEIVYYNYGNGNGFSVCLECGRADVNSSELIGHKRLRGGKNANNNSICNGNENNFSIHHNVMLVGRFQTNFFEIRCKDVNGVLIDDEKTLYSLGHVFAKSLCVFLAIEEQEVDFGIKNYRGFRSIFFFDTAKGGAGYVSQCATHFEAICREALSFVSRNCCQSACTKCLIDRKSQHHLEHLDKNLAKCLLERILDNTIPDNVANLLNNPIKIIGNIKTDIARFITKKQIHSLTLFVDFQSIDEWNIENFLLLRQLQLNNKSIKLVFRGQPVGITTEQKITLLHIKASLGIQNIYYTDSFQINNLMQIARLQLIDDSQYDYFAENFITSLSSQWGDVDNQFTYRQQANNNINFIRYDLTFDNVEQNMFEILIPTFNNRLHSNKIFDLFFNKLPNYAQDNLDQLLSNQNVTIIYSDRYLTKPLACLLVLQFIKRLEKKYNINIEHLNLQMEAIRNQYNNYNNAIYTNKDFISDHERSDFISSKASDCSLNQLQIDIAHNIPHFRYLQINITNSNRKITIRPDAGIGYAWNATNRYQQYADIAGDFIFYIQQNRSQDLLYTLSFN